MSSPWILLLGFAICVLGNDPECTTYDHPDYGYSGQCIATSECPGDKFISNLCPTKPNDVKCCFTVGSDNECVTYNHPTHGQVGYCVDTSQCPGDNYISNLCPTLPDSVKCCFSKPDNTPPPGDCSGIRIVTRAEWGARPPTSVSYLTLPVPYAFVHHTAGSSCSSVSECIAVVRGVQNYHMDSLGWSDIGYSFLVGEDGNIYEGRGWDRVGAHTGGYNDVGLAWSYMGTFTSRLPNQAAIDAGKRAIACGETLGKLTSSYTLRGHRDMSSTACPGDKLYPEIQKWPHY
ncbi:peptidoglycan-recognition protein SC2-like [Amphiura filiformis]|uniref:peptidoglycan-recognition protein SC2-like n=1 Tax=Amphiura filiformis TaxID=82378 RepID=UPI003B221134